ncbi:MULTISPECIES: thioesterase II family protein [Bacillus cereus group]|uniref:Thioesterase n=2 Tax=Bacillus cereus group TaxID=86661 RepID=A0AB73UEX9_BACCE|nr:MULTISPECIES: thioesterase domain-containing protein [Bacillus cereus group]MED3024758.1 thioesterase domain-containing protein [Bacillus wiedmannii]OTX97410.1 thioesterase [Bacillus thuringiensis serovar wratislaviensis]OUB62084.1 thioesterase [Bacillus thuringiensis serovar sylvestriensis]QHV02376.1 thioesterase [Bacillus cereus]QHV43052.1 thioesterase [Bacillus cereus]
MKIICLPYAGGSASIFNRWSDLLLPEIRIENIEIAGRGKRSREACYTNVLDVVEDIYSIVEKGLDDEPYVIFGHSMGGLLAFELGHKIQQENRRLPEAYFFSGKSAPNLPTKEIVHEFEEERFIDRIFSLGGTPAELLHHKDLLDIYLSIIRADYKVVETYEFPENRDRLNTPFYILYGDKDVINLDEILAWENHTSKSCKWYEFYGGHFFIKNQENRVLNLVNRILTEELKIGV